MVEATKSLFRGKSPADAPLYSLGDVVRHLRLPPRWPLAWPDGQLWLFDEEPHPSRPTFTFRALVNVFLLSHRAEWLTVVRPKSRGLLLLATGGVELLVSADGDVRYLRPADSEADVPAEARLYKSRVEWEGEVPVRLYPFSRARINESAPRPIVLDPRRSFGNPILAASGIRTDVIAGRFRAGESVAELSQDLEVPANEVEEAVRYESVPAP